MNLRTILFILSLLAFSSASTGGWLYYSSLRESAILAADRRAGTRMEMIHRNLSYFLSENTKPVKSLAGLRELRTVLIDPKKSNYRRVNAVLDHFNRTLDVDVTYLMNSQGLTVASSNRHNPESFAGKNFGFRPYFKRAIKGSPTTYLALGTTTNKRGIYYSHPVYEEEDEPPIGVAVIKAPVGKVERELITGPEEIIMVTDPHGVIFICNRISWLFNVLWKITPEEKADIAKSLQFGKGPWPWTGIELQDERHLHDRSGREYLFRKTELDNFPGWNIIYLSNFDAISRNISAPLIRVTAPVIVSLCFLIGIAVSLLYRKASHEIIRRRTAEQALRESKERYRSIYHNTPAMLHSVDKDGIMVSVSDHWARAMGFEREEVVGRSFSDFLSEESARRFKETVFPEFLKTGFCNDVPYHFVKKNGESMDILLSAIGERGKKGEVVRSMAVSVDITKLKKAEKELKAAKEELDLYSRELERQVRIRTAEISGILKYSPNAVYMKDLSGRYRLVNYRFEELFDVKNEDIRGKLDIDIFPPRLSKWLGKGDKLALEKKRSYQTEEQMERSEGVFTYLRVKFPIYDETGAILGLCGILTDITAVKKAEQRMRRLSANIMENQEKERSAIARELHDELGQILTALRFDATWIAERVKRESPGVADRAQTMCELIENTISEVRQLALRLRPGVLDDLGLIDAMEWYTTDFERRTGIPCAFNHESSMIISGDVATAAYRIAQEAMTNAARHAEARQVQVTLEIQNDRLVLTVKDDGKGFNVTSLPEGEGLGITGMHERSFLVGGTLDVETREKGGTTVRFTAPFQ